MKILKRRDQQSLSGDSIFQMQRTYHGLQATSVSFVLSVALFMQNEPNFFRCRRIISAVMTKRYENITVLSDRKNEPKTNPN